MVQLQVNCPYCFGITKYYLIPYPQVLSVINCPMSCGSKLHPSEKPNALLKTLIKTYTNEGDCVLDFCMGSGSCGIAAIEAKRSFIGIELDSDYFNVASKRIDDYCSSFNRSIT